MVLTGDPEEDKKALIAMLGKLYISTNSETEKLQSTAELVMEAIDNRVAQDAPSRNSLNKLYLALSRALGEAEKIQPISEDTLAPAGRADGLTTVKNQETKESVMADEEYVRIKVVEDTEVQDPSLEESLKDDEDGS